MKKRRNKPFLRGLLLLLLLSSCNKAPMNGPLDGMWQLMEITRADGEKIDVKAEQRYYCVQLRLLSFVKTGSCLFLGRFVYNGDSLLIHDVRIYFSEERLASKEALWPFGMSDVSEHFAVEEITCSRMVLKSEHATLGFRKY
ncbi:MAG: lipocalin-like domain-containing protein [Tannerellaceae bacterium]|jgi:hypothetical protein|nr:lipocalin-like domain-containing protein [Tannerellaceae bacterium]